jgi:tetratricopeptide (TPR) repeat protein
MYICSALCSGSDRGIQLFHERKFTLARKYFERAFHEDSTDHSSAFYLGRIFLIRDDYDKAVEWLEIAVRFNDRSSEYHRWLGRACGYNAQDAFILKQPFLAKKTLKMFERAVELDPGNIEARISLTHYFIKAPGFMGGGAEKAKKQVEEIRKRDANTWLLAQGIIDSKNENYEKAEECLMKFLENAPAENSSLVSDGHYELGAVYEKQGRRELAIKEYELSLQSNPDNKEAKAGLKKMKGA